MSESDPIRQKWESEYSGRTDNGFELPISQVVPGMIINGQPIGYFPASSPEQIEKAWKWDFRQFNQRFH